MIDFTTMNQAAAIDAKHEALRANNRDLRGCYTDSPKPVTKKVAKRRLQAASDKQNRAMDLLEQMENW